MNWQVAIVILLAKSEEFKEPGKFRPIAVSNVEGKTFFTILGKRFLRFMTANNYIKGKSQKGLIDETPGCLEHTTPSPMALTSVSHGLILKMLLEVYVTR